MRRRVRTVVVVFSFMLGPVALTGSGAQEFHFTGGAVEGTQVKANNQSTSVAEAAGYVLLPSSSITVHVAAGDNDLFVFEFSAECSMVVSPGQGDHIRLQARFDGFVSAPFGGGPSILQPQNSPPDHLVDCRSRHTISRMWAVRIAGGASGADHTFSIWWRVVDSLPDDGDLFGLLDNRIVRSTRYH
jgi:hypothetical protein